MNKLIALMVLSTGLATAQQTGRFVAPTGAVTLAAATTAATLQQPSSNSDQFMLEGAVVRCPAACTITQKQNGTAATATDSTTSIKPILPYRSSTTTVKLYTASNVGSGTTVGTTVCDAACTIILDLSKVTLNAGANYTISLSSVTGDAYITFYGNNIK